MTVTITDDSGAVQDVLDIPSMGDFWDLVDQLPEGWAADIETADDPRLQAHGPGCTECPLVDTVPGPGVVAIRQCQM